MSRFKKIYVEITNYCNLNCEFCSNDNIKKYEMSLEQFEHILNEIKPYTNYIYLHVKGEPLLHSKFKDIISLCDKYNFKVNITTNGTLLSKQKNILINPCIRQINISLQSYTNLEKLKEVIDTVNIISKNKNTSIVYRFWALTDNQIFNKEIFNYLKDYYNFEGTGKNIRLADNIYVNKNELFEWPSLHSNDISDNYCLGTISHIGILSNGTVIPCCLDSNGIVNLGNIFEKTFKSILEDEKFININQKFKNNKCTEQLCKHCKFKHRFKKCDIIK